jgi:hypothetical protein
MSARSEGHDAKRAPTEPSGFRLYRQQFAALPRWKRALYISVLCLTSLVSFGNVAFGLIAVLLGGDPSITPVDPPVDSPTIY